MWSVDCIKVTYKHEGMYGSHPPSYKCKQTKGKPSLSSSCCRSELCDKPI
jgi:hypothetical protein